MKRRVVTKKVAKPKPQPSHPVTTTEGPPSTTVVTQPPVSSGCLEVRFETKPRDSVVKIAIFGNTTVSASDSCFAIDGGPWRNNACGKSYQCDFRKDEMVTGKKLQLVGSFHPKPGQHVVRLPACFADKAKGYVAAFFLVRGSDVWPTYPSAPAVGTKTAFRAAYAYGEKRAEWQADHSDAMGVRWFDYENGSARIYYSRTEVPKNAPQLYWPWHEWKEDP